MSADAHAIILLGVPLAAVALVLGTARRRLRIGDTLVSLIVLAVLSGVVCIIHMHKCRRGDPDMQSMIIAGAIALVMVFSKSRFVSAGFTVVSMVTMVLLCHHYENLVHGDDWTGSFTYDQYVAGRNRDAIQSIRRRLCKAEDVDVEYAEGWLRDLPLSTAVTSYLESELGSVKVRAAWHSTFTHLLHVDRTPVDFWYPGGTLTESADRIILKDRPERTPHAENLTE